MPCSRRQFINAGIAGLSGSALLAGRQSQTQTPAGFVKVSGKDLIAPTGEKLRLRGINLGNWFEPEGYMFLFEGGPQSPREIEAFFDELIGPAAAAQFWKEYRRRYITKSDIEWIERSGLNSVRIPLHYKFFLPDGDGFEMLDAALEWCRVSGIWVVLDMHCAPGGQTGANIDDSWGYPWLYESGQEQDLLCQIWKQIAQRYRNEPAIIGYDLLNEPIPHFPQLQKYNVDLEPLYRRITAGIREVDSNHAVILEGAQWATNFTVFGPPFDSNAIYQFHKYWMKVEPAAIGAYVNFRDRYNVPIWLGESGENTDEWIRDFAGLLNQNDIGWCFWPYKKMEKPSCMTSVVKPTYWDEITAFAKLPSGTGNAEKRIASRPSMEHVKAAFAELLDNIRWENCRVNAGYLQALGLKGS